MHTRLETLELTDEQRNRARQQIEQMAYGKWRDAGCPDDSGLQFWVAAEKEWIHFHYTPCRYSTLERHQPPKKPR